MFHLLGNMVTGSHKKCSGSCHNRQHAFFERPLANRRALLVSAGCDHGNSLPYAGLRRKLSGYVSAHAARLSQFTEMFFLYSKYPKQFLIPTTGFQIHKIGSAAIGIIRYIISSHPIDQILRNIYQFCRPAINLGPLPADPRHLPARKYRIHFRAADIRNLIVICFQALAQFLMPGILPHHYRHQWLSILIQWNDGRPLRRYCDRIYRLHLLPCFCLDGLDDCGQHIYKFIRRLFQFAFCIV